MKKLKPFIVGIFILLFSTSCTVTYHSVTNNEIGDAEGESSGTPLTTDLDLSYKSAVDDGSIEKISTTKFRVTYYLFIPFYRTKVTGQSE